MNKILLIISREVKAKLMNKTFIIMTVLAPVLIATFFGLIIKMTQSEKTDQKVLVLDESKLFINKLSGNDYISLSYSGESLDQAQSDFHDRGFTCLLWISPTIVDAGAGAVKLIYKKSPGYAFQGYIKDQMERILYEYKLKANNIDPDIIRNSRLKVKMIVQKVDDQGQPLDTGDFGFVGFLIGALMFMFVLMYGMMVFRSVMEEKTNRIVEVVISSVRPFQLMIGKILGVAVVGIIQFVAMSIITFVLVSVLSVFLLKDANEQLKTFEAQQELVKKHGTNANLDQMEKFEDKRDLFELLQKMKKIDFAAVLICFAFYFIGGYLFYSSLMAAIGSAVDSEADSQQFITPVMLPLILGYIIALKTIMDPDSATVFWASMIPFTSPIVMMARVSNGIGVPVWQIFVSLLVLYTTFIFTVWLASRIYRTGILMYGKKASWREIMKWLFYK
jgi:ABC-2 type transport system permease protein